MGILGGKLGYFILKQYVPRGLKKNSLAPHHLVADTRLTELFGDDFYKQITGKVVIDFGCGGGKEAIEMALHGAEKVIGIDIRERLLEAGKELSIKYGVSYRCTFTTQTSERGDIIISKDAFEHFEDPPAVLKQMRRLLKPNGCVMAAFGPTWLHPYGGHLFSVFPWAHLIFTENTLLRWRSNFRSDGATRFSQVEGGLNQLTISKFESIVKNSPFEFEFMETMPIKGLNLLKFKLLREFGSSIVRCKLIPKAQK
jgi:SAM-dependent methyltransferase